MEMEVTLKNQENPAEEVKVSKEKITKLTCHIDNNNNPISHLSEGVNISLSGEVEKFSDTLQRNSVYSKESKVNRLVSKL
jgi:hypothetical protein